MIYKLLIVINFYLFINYIDFKFLLNNKLRLITLTPIQLLLLVILKLKAINFEKVFFQDIEKVLASKKISCGEKTIKLYWLLVR